MATINRVRKASKAVNELDQIEDGTKSERMGPKLGQDNTVRSELVTFDNLTEEKGLDPLDRGPI